MPGAGAEEVAGWTAFGATVTTREGSATMRSGACREVPITGCCGPIAEPAGEGAAAALFAKKTLRALR